MPYKRGVLYTQIVLAQILSFAIIPLTRLQATPNITHPSGECAKKMSNDGLWYIAKLIHKAPDLTILYALFIGRVNVRIVNVSEPHSGNVNGSEPLNL